MSNLSEPESAISRNRDSAASNDSSQLDSAGQAILKLLHKAAGVAEANSRHAVETAQKLSRQLRETENRIAELEAENQLYREKAERAEQWLMVSVFEEDVPESSATAARILRRCPSETPIFSRSASVK